MIRRPWNGLRSDFPGEENMPRKGTEKRRRPVMDTAQKHRGNGIPKGRTLNLAYVDFGLILRSMAVHSYVPSSGGGGNLHRNQSGR